MLVLERQNPGLRGDGADRQGGWGVKLVAKDMVLIRGAERIMIDCLVSKNLSEPD